MANKNKISFFTKTNLSKTLTVILEKNNKKLNIEQSYITVPPPVGTQQSITAPSPG
jgi:hypothetical protein